MEFEPPDAVPLTQIRLPGQARSRTIALKRISKDERRIGALLYPERPKRPQTRAECEGGIRPCPYVGCKYHLYLDINPVSGSIKINFPDREVWEMQHSCSLDIAAEGVALASALGGGYDRSRRSSGTSPGTIGADA